jgi:hypothetical protein
VVKCDVHIEHSNAPQPPSLRLNASRRSSALLTRQPADRVLSVTIRSRTMVLMYHCTVHLKNLVRRAEESSMSLYGHL